MSKAYEEKPDTWADWADVKHAGGDLYYTIVGDGIVEGGKASNVWVWHWHTPTGLPARWQLSGCGLHTVIQAEPLTIRASLACEDGCTWHGWLTNGVWSPC